MIAMVMLLFLSQLMLVSTGAFTSRSISKLKTHAVRELPKTTKSSALKAIKEATFGMGCFWEPAESLLKQPGVLDTTVGYTGASLNKPPPTYDTVCFGNDYVEAVQVVYDDNIVTYNQLLDYFFEFQKPGIKRQYASVVFVDEGSEDGKDEARKVLAWKEEAMLSKGKRKDNLPYEIVQVEPLTKFYRAESYHQRYWEKQRLRAFVGLLLIAGASGAYDTLFDGAVGDLSFFGWSFDTLCNAAFLVGAGWMLLERLIARDVQELKRGDLMDSFVRGST